MTGRDEQIVERERLRIVAAHQNPVLRDLPRVATTDSSYRSFRLTVLPEVSWSETTPGLTRGDPA